MKKLNRKGFTLIELLAVIVILAVVLVVTIPSVIDTMNDARAKSLQNAANTVEEWFTKQYEIETLGATLGSGTNDSAYTTFKGSNNFTTSQMPLTSEVLKAAGVSDTTGLSGTIELKGTKICISLTAVQGSTFFNNTTNGNTKSSASC